MGPGVLDRVKNPEYIGENRCFPCTVLNTAIAIGVSGVVALLSIPAAGVVFAGSVLAIALRGYLIPGTPTLVQFLPDRIHEAIGPEHALDEETVEIDIEETLTAAGIIEECDDEEDLCLTDGYRAAWHSEIERLRDEQAQRARLSASLSVPADDIEFETTDGRLDVFVDDIRAGSWQSKAAFLADLGSQQLLASWLDNPGWESIPANDRTQLLVALRTFVETCPACGGTVVPDEEVVRSCCRDDMVSVTTTCTDCGATVFRGTDA